MTGLELTIRDLRTRAVLVPMARPLATRIGSFEAAPLLLIDLETEEGVTGHAYLFGYLRRGCAFMAAVLDYILETTRGRTIAPTDLYGTVTKSLTLAGHQGIATMAASGFDVACWDALAQAAGVPLVTLLGGTVQPVRAYNSNGLGLMSPEAAAAEARELVAEGNFGCVKVRVGRETLAEDLAAVRAVRRAVGDDIVLPCDFNQGLTVMEAIARGRAFDHEDLHWIEEPIVYDDLDGCARIAREVATPIQIGENFYGPKAMAEAIAARAGDYMMPDLQRIGGVTGWLRAAALAEAAGIEMSSHLFPEVSSHLLAVTPTRHWLEYVNWAAPILAEPLKIEDGQALIPDRPGTGVAWNEDAVAKYALAL
ncbi:MAG: enolase C-terminal domain-like protein [Alphaproteobacteria bacterium]|jgi:mandelate racemase|nr:enolase C-terminal domain-like protein [Alphaproteobacteria bacterium]